MSGRRGRDEGAALLTVMLAMVILTGLVVALTTMVLGQTSFSRNARDREGSVHAAEAGAESVLAQLVTNPAFATVTHTACAGSSTYHCLPDGLSDEQQRAWAVTQYQEAKAAGSAAVISVPGGTAYGIRPVWAGTTTLLDLVFGVGEIGPAPGKVRVTRVRTEAATSTALSRGLTVGSDVTVTNGAKVEGGLHTGGSLSVSQSTLTGAVTCGGAVCPGGTAGTALTLPDVRARSYHRAGAPYAAGWLDLCDDGTARRWASSGPCTGTLATASGWSWSATYRRWTGSGDVATGVYYAHHASIRMTGGGKPTVTLLASRDPAVNDPLQGNAWVDDGVVVTPYLPLVGMVGDRDVCICNGGGGKGGVGTAQQPAAVVAGEQLYVWESTVIGAAVALDNAYWGGPTETVGSPSQVGKDHPNGPAWDYIPECGVPDCVWQARVVASPVSLLDASRLGVSGWREL